MQLHFVPQVFEKFELHAILSKIFHYLFKIFNEVRKKNKWEINKYWKFIIDKIRYNFCNIFKI